MILSAGRSSRMGESKAELQLHGKTLVEHHAESFMGFGQVYIVMGKHNFKEFKNVKSLINPFAPECTPFESLQYGLTQLKEMALPTFLLPVDFMPMPKEIWEPMLKEERTGKLVVRPSFQGKAGHPVLLSCAFQKKIKSMKEGRLDNLIRELSQTESSVLEFPFAQVHQQFNTQEEFKKFN